MINEVFASFHFPVYRIFRQKNCTPVTLLCFVATFSPHFVFPSGLKLSGILSNSLCDFKIVILSLKKFHDSKVSGDFISIYIPDIRSLMCKLLICSSKIIIHGHIRTISVLAGCLSSPERAL